MTGWNGHPWMTAGIESRSPRLSTLAARRRAGAHARLSATAALSLALIAACTGAEAGPTAAGSLSHGGESTTLGEISVVSLYDDGVAVLVADRPVRPPCEVFDAMGIAEKESLTGFVITVDKGSLELHRGGLNSLLHPGLPSGSQFGLIEDGLSLERSEGGFVQGTLAGSYEYRGESYELSVELSFPLDLEAPVIRPRRVEGAESKPARAFAEFVEAVVSGDLEIVKGFSTAGFREEIDQIDPAEAAEMLPAFADFFLPATITITDSEVDGDRAVLTANGVSEVCMGTEESAGLVELVREGRRWKIASVSFKG